MSLEDQYDAWVRSVTGTGRHSATKQDRDAAQNSLNAMQAQLDALAESQKRQKSAADALNAVQRAGAATADSVRRMSSELTQSLRQDGLLGGKTAQPAPAAEPVKAGPENFNGLADRVRQQVLGQDAFVGQVVKAFRRPFVMGTADTAHARGSMLLCGPTGTGRHYALTCIVDEMAGRGLLHSALIETMDLALYPGPAQEKLFLQDLYAALQSDAEVLAFDHYESCASNYLNMLATLAIDGTLPLTSRYVLQRGILVDVGTALAPGAIGELQAAGKYFVFFSNRDETALEAARQRLAPYADRVTLVHSNFDRVDEILDELGLTPPKFYHLPLLLASDGRRLSKRDGDQSLENLREKYTPEEIIGKLAFACGLQASPAPTTPQALARTFDWSQVPKSDIVLPENLF